MDKLNQLQKTQKKIVNKDTRIAALRKQLIYYKEITETVNQPFVILGNNLKVVTANLAFYRKFKELKINTEGKSIYELGDGQWDSSELRDLLENILPAHRILSNYIVRHNFPKIGSKIFLLNARQVDRKQLILIALVDITEE